MSLRPFVAVLAIAACGDDSSGEGVDLPSAFEQGCLMSCCEGPSADSACIDACPAHPDCQEAYERLGDCAAGLSCCGGRGPCSAVLLEVETCVSGPPSPPDAGAPDGRVDGCDFLAPEVPVVCSNGLDDDCNGLVDCDDPQCASIESCGGGEGEGEGEPPQGGCADEPTLVSLRTYPGAGGQAVQAAASTADGGVVIVGQSFGRVDFGDGPIDATGSRALFVVRLDADGEAAWTRQFLGTHDDVEVYAVEVDDDGAATFCGYVTGTIDFGDVSTEPRTDDVDRRESFVARVDADGETVWANRYATGTAWALALGPDGDVWVTGDFSTAGSNGPADFGRGEIMGPGSADIFVLRLAADGGTVDAWPLGGPNGDQTFDIDVDDGGDVLLSVLGGDGADWGDGVVNRHGGDAGDFHILRLSPDGELRWGRKINGGYGGADVAFDDRTGTILMRSSGDVVSLDGTGTEVWRTEVVTGFRRDFAIDGEGGVWVFGDIDPASAGCVLAEGEDTLFARLAVSACGEPLRARRARPGDGERDLVPATMLLGSDELVVVGAFSGSGVDLGDGPMDATSATVFVARYGL